MFGRRLEVIISPLLFWAEDEVPVRLHGFSMMLLVFQLPHMLWMKSITRSVRFFNCPVCNFDELVKDAEKYVFVCGIGVPSGGDVVDSKQIKNHAMRKKQFANDSRITTKYLPFLERFLT